MNSWIEVAVGESGLQVPKEALLSRSRYFQHALEGMEQEEVPKVAMPDVQSEAECLRFVGWLSLYPEKSFAGSRWSFFCLHYCDVVQVTPEIKEMALRSLTLPESHDQLTPEQRIIWASVPFQFAKEAIVRVPEKLEQIAFAFSWIREKSPASESEQQYIEQMSEFAETVANDLEPSFSSELLPKFYELVQDLPVALLWLKVRLN